MFWDLVFEIYLELGTCDLEIVWKLEIENWKLIRLLLVMKILVDFSELLVSDVGVDLGGGD